MTKKMYHGVVYSPKATISNNRIRKLFRLETFPHIYSNPSVLFLQPFLVVRSVGVCHRSFWNPDQKNALQMNNSVYSDENGA